MGKKERTSIFLVASLLLFCWASITEAKHDEKEIYKDKKAHIEDRVSDLLKRMTLAEKIGQMVQAERLNVTADLMKQYFLGSVLSGGGSVPAKKASPEAWVDMVNDFQKGALATRLGIPMIYGVDAVHGHNNVYGATIFPHNIGLGATRDPELVKKIGEATALEVRATGIPYAFAPCIAVCRDPRWGRCYESYSEDPKIVQMMTEIIPGLQGERPSKVEKGYPYVAGHKFVASSTKHYVGDGGTVKGINENNTIVTNDELMNIHMPAYLDAIEKGTTTIMISYSSLNGVKMHANREMVTDYLKNKLNFKGFVISDYQGIDKITPVPGSNYTYSVEKSILAGIDMVMVGYTSYVEFINILTKLVETNVVPMSRIDDAVTRILRVKFAMGLFEKPLAEHKLAEKVGSKSHRKLAREAVRKSLVLLKNGKSASEPLLPLSKKAPKILVAGAHANNLGLQCGGWTIEWQGLNTTDLTEGTTILQAIKETAKKSQVVYYEYPTADAVKSGEFDYAVVVVGEPPYAEGFGDNKNLTIPAPGPDIINNVCKNVKCVVVLISGRPLVVEPYIDTMDAFVAAWLPGSEGQGVADVLFGVYGFTGKLPRTWFKRVDQLPMNVWDKNYDPLFPFGFGLTTEGHKRKRIE